MLTLATMSLAMALQAATPTDVAPSNGGEQFTETAYKELSEGQTTAAIAEMEIMRAKQAQDPALLINLGTAYAQLGMISSAREAFTEAKNMRERVELELADGTWVDSRRIARKALSQLDRQASLAMR